MQSPSFLEYQRRLGQAHGKNNAQTLFGAHQIPSDNQIRHLLDATPASQLKPLFSSLFKALDQAGVIERYRSVNQTLLLALDGTEYFSSSHLHCPNCSTRRHANGKVTYFHTALTPVLVKPGLDKVIPLAPEFVQPQDRPEKQDGELNAAKRWLAAWSETECVPKSPFWATTDAQGRVLYRNAFATSLGVDERRVVEVVAAGSLRA